MIKIKENYWKIFIIALLLLISFVIFIFSTYKNNSQKPTKAILQVNGETVAEFKFSDYKNSEIISLEQYGLHGKIEIKEGAVRFVEMDCPDKICIKTSWITKVTESAVCLPNKAYLTVK